MTTKSLIYKIARFNNDKETRNLKELLIAALGKKKHAVSRRMQADGAQQFTLINYHGSHRGMRVAELIDYTAGHKQPFTKIDMGAETLEISSLAPPDKQSEFLHNILYFAAYGNSVIISQSSSLRSQQLEDYLNWLLQEADIFKDGQFFTLSDHPPLDDKAEITTAKAIEFNAPVALNPVVKRGDKEVAYYRPSAVGWDIVKKLFPDDFKLPGRLKASDIVGSGELNVSVKLSWTRDDKNDTTAFMDGISNSLRHIDDELDYTVITRSGKITKDEIKLKRPISVKSTDDGIVQKLDMWAKMEEWLAELIQQNRIDPKA